MPLLEDDFPITAALLFLLQRVSFLVLSACSDLHFTLEFLLWLF